MTAFLLVSAVIAAAELLGLAHTLRGIRVDDQEWAVQQGRLRALNHSAPFFRSAGTQLLGAGAYAATAMGPEAISVAPGSRWLVEHADQVRLTQHGLFFSGAAR